MSQNNDSAFETNPEGSAFETAPASNDSAFESEDASSSSQASAGTRSGATAAETVAANIPGALILVDDARKAYVLRDEVELKDQGAMGCVSSAIWIDGRSEKKVLLKRLFKPVNPNQEKLFSNEGFMSRDYGGQSVVKLYGKGETEEFLFMIMEFYEGQTLDKLIDQGAYQGRINKSYRLIRDILNALEDLHGAEVVHRDLKPTNLIIRQNGKPVILDLGLACQTGLSDVAGLKKIGTPKYAAPEQLKGQFSCASDIYSVGKIFLEIYTGEIDNSHIESIPEPYRDFVRTCLSESPDERYANAEDALEALGTMNMMERSSIVTTDNVDNTDKMKIEIAKKFGDDCLLDETEEQELRSMAKRWNVEEDELEMLIDAASNEVQKFRRNNIIGCLLQKKGYAKAAIMDRAKKLYIESDVVEQWLEDTPSKLRVIAEAYVEGDEAGLEALLEETPVNMNWIDAIQERFYREKRNQRRRKEIPVPQTSTPQLQDFAEVGEKKGCTSYVGKGCGCFVLIILWLLFKSLFF